MSTTLFTFWKYAHWWFIFFIYYTFDKRSIKIPTDNTQALHQWNTWDTPNGWIISIIRPITLIIRWDRLSLSRLMAKWTFLHINSHFAVLVWVFLLPPQCESWEVFCYFSNDTPLFKKGIRWMIAAIAAFAIFSRTRYY